ncbi:MAG TPA: hypothetical protein VHY08_10470 [Bacillota bacterium]|nr:hypothetical protein [Bacillota bacterium]
MNAMAEAMLKELLKTKLKMMNRVIQVLPPQMKEPVTDFQQSILRVVNEVTKEYGEVQQTPGECEKGLAAIKIE